MKKLIFITLLMSVSTVLGLAQETARTNKEAVQAISQVAVTLLTPTGEKVQSVTTNEQGAFAFSNVAAGKYVVAVGPAQYNPKELEVSKRVAEYRVITAREAGSGMATGRRQYQPLIIRKRIDKSTPLLAKKSASQSVVAITTEKSATAKNDACDDDCDGSVEITLGFGEKVNAGLHQAGSALASGASLLGGSIPGGSILSSALTIQQGIEVQATGVIDGNLMMVTKVKTKSNQANDKQTQGATFGEKTRHDTVKNSVGNIR